MRRHATLTLAILLLCSCTSQEQEADAWNASQHIPPPTLVAKASALESRLNIAASIFSSDGGVKYKVTTVYYLIYSDGTKREVDVAEYALAKVPDAGAKP